MNDITQLLRGMEQGEEHAADRLLAVVYDELRQLAAAKMAHEAAGHTLQPTALVHEAWLRLGGNARVWIGFHVRAACEVGRDTGYEIANHAVKHHLRLRHRGWCDRRGRWHGDESLRD